MAPSRRKGAGKAAGRQWKVGDLVLAKVRGFPAWPAMVSEPEKWGYSADWKKVVVFFFGTQQIAFCNPGDVEPFTEEKKQTLLVKRQGKGADFVRAVQEIVDSYDKLKTQVQVDDLNSGTDVSAGNCGNSVESTPNLQSQGTLEAPAETSDAQSKLSNLLVKTVSNENIIPGKKFASAPLEEDINIKPEVEEPVVEKQIKQRPVICTYSLRNKSRDSQVESSISRMVPSAKRYRGLSKTEASGLESFAGPSVDSEERVAVIMSNTSQYISCRKSRQISKTPDIFKGDDVGSPTFVQNGSIENNDSGTVSMERDSLSPTDDSAADSSPRHGIYETVVDCVDGPDMQLNAALKKRRKPNRKRVFPEPTSSADSGAATDIANSAGSDFGSISARSVKICCKDDGDEHLPLLKRARVRMGELSSQGNENNGVVSSKERVLKDVMEKSLVLNHQSFCEEKVLEQVQMNVSDYIDNNISHTEKENIKDLENTPLNSACVCHDFDCPLVKKEASDVVSIPEDCNGCSKTKPSSWKLNKNQLYVSSADGEATLPPSKRLHRAFKAMSANVAQECPSSGASSNVETAVGTCFSSQSSCVAIACENGDASNEHTLDSVPDHIFDVAASPPFPIDQTSSGKVHVEELDICQPPTEKSESPMHVEEIAVVRKVEDVQNVCISIAENPTGDSLMKSHSMKPLSPHTVAGEPSAMLDQALHDPLRTKGEVNTVAAENSAEDSARKYTDPAQNDTISLCSVPETQKVAAFHPVHGIEELQKSSECPCETGGNEHLRHQCLNAILDETKSHGDEIGHDQVILNGKSAPCSNGDLDDNCIAVCPPTDVNHSTPGMSSQHNAVILNTCNLDEDKSKNSRQDNESCSSVEASHLSSSAKNAADSAGKVDSSVTPLGSIGKCENHSEADAALASFGAVLVTLTRTKESIGRATHIALDCEKHGFSSKAFEVLVRSLENESNLHRRVDIFFLIDSIMQTTRGIKGDAAEGYPSLIKGALSRILSAAAPSGSTSHENRRQCLKVLKLWLERRYLPESILRHHIRELDLRGPSSVNPYARRSARNERAFDDPVREMEGMLVDEYGSNSSFQLPGFCMPRMLKDGDEGSDSDSEGSFEAVTPEHTTPKSPHQETTSTIGKHRHILQDVDGELEMEDVAPSEGEMVDSSQNVGRQFPASHHAATALSVLTSSPQSISPLPPSLPPPPSLASLAPHPPLPVTSSTPDCHVNGLPRNASTQNIQENMGQPILRPLRADQRDFGGPHYRNSVCRESQQQMPMSDLSNNAYNRRSVEDGDHEDRSRFSNNWGYHMRPPYPPQSNHFSCDQSDQRGRARRDCPPPHSGRFHNQHNRGNGNYHHNNHERMKPPPHETRDNWRCNAPYSGQRYPDKGKSSCAPGPYGGPTCKAERFQNHGWSSYPPRPMGHRNHVPHRTHYEGSGYWSSR